MKGLSVFKLAALIVAITFANGTMQSAQAQHFTILYQFKGMPDGANPQGTLIRDSRGTLYGTTRTGGSANLGTIFKLCRSGEDKIVHSLSDPAEGMHPTAGLVRDAAGNLYGTTPEGGIELSFGTLFQVDRSGSYNVMIRFGAGDDGGWPDANLMWGADGNLYGTTQLGGEYLCPAYGCGVVFKVDPLGHETTLYSFMGPFFGTDGWNPNSLLGDEADNLYGTTRLGGLGTTCGGHGCGTIFKLDPAGQEIVQYRFTGGADGASPRAGVVRDTAGNLYGSTYEGGEHGYGVIFKLDPSGTLKILHSFTGGWDGANPHGELIWGNSGGKLFGTTVNGGRYGFGVVFSLEKPHKLTILHSFTGGADGAHPYAGLLGGPGDRKYGTASAGGISGGSCGTTGCGTIFRIMP